MYRKLSSIFVLLPCLFGMAVQETLAVPAVPWPVEKTQPDGSKITVYLKGDEKVHRMESEDGYTLMYDSLKYIVYAEKDSEGNLVPSKVRAGDSSSKIPVREKGLFYSKQQLATLRQIWKMTETEIQKAPGAEIQKAPVTGTKKALCVLMGFSDKAFTKSVEEFTNLMNQIGYTTGGAKGSVRDFYRENSYGKMDLIVTVVGPYTAPNSRSYYGEPKGSNYQEFAKEAANAANVDVNYAEFAVNGTLETFHIIFAGYGDEAINNGEQIWSHKWATKSPITLDGVQVSTYSCSPELRGSSGNNITYIGVIAHELCHVFGAPDYYDTDTSEGGFYGTGNWDLMAGGSWNDNGRQPAHINMLQKILFGWVDPIALTEETQVTDMPNSAENPIAYTIEANGNGEKYILENKQKKGFDASLPGKGLLILHAHQNALGGDAGNSGHPQELYPVVASSTTAIPNSTVSSYGSINSGGTPFPGTSKKNAFTDTSVPQAFSWATSSGIGKPLTNISEAGNGTISFGFMRGSVKDPVTGLTKAAGKPAEVSLSWTAPDNNWVEGYNIYKGNVFHTYVSGKSNTGYEEKNVPVGDYTYCVTAKYEFAESVTACIPVSVTANPLSFTADVEDKEYDGNRDATIGNLVFTNLIDGDILTEGIDYSASAAFLDSNAENNKYVTVTVSLLGNAALKYYLASDVFNTTAGISKKELTVTGIVADNKTYDGTDAATVTGKATLDGVVDGDDVELAGTPRYTFVDANVAEDVDVTVSGFEFDGEKKNNYTLIQPLLSADIKPVSLTVTPNEGQNKPANSPDPKLTYETDGWILDDNETLLSGSLAREEGEEPDYYEILRGSLDVESNNYVIDFVSGVYFEIKSELGIAPTANSGPKVYPSPSYRGEAIYVSTNVPNAEIRIFTVTGILLMQQKATGTVTEINLTVAPGIYIVSVNGEKAKAKIKVRK